MLNYLRCLIGKAPVLTSGLCCEVWPSSESWDGANYHVGYYDHSPFDESGQFCLMHRVVHGSDSSLGLLNVGTGTYRYLSFVGCYSSQFGSRAQWVSGGNEVTFNSVDTTGLLVNKRVRVDSGQVIDACDYPVFDWCPAHEKALVCDFGRLGLERPGYGYESVCDGNPLGNRQLPGILCIVGSEETRAISRAELREFLQLDTELYVNHLSWNPTGQYFCFYAVWNTTRGRRSRLVIADREGCLIAAPPDIDFVSHHAWLSADKILFSGSVLGRSGFYIFEIETGSLFFESNLVGRSDGHPSVWVTGSDDESFVILDEYPDRFGVQTLIKFKFNCSTLEHLGWFYTPKSLVGKKKCDLHPRIVNRDSIVLDIFLDGVRRSCIVRPR